MKNIGAFEAHAENIIEELLNEVRPYYKFSSNEHYHTTMYMALCDYLDNNDECWVWNIIKSESDLDDDDKAYNILNKISKELVDESFILRKKVYNSYKELVDVVVTHLPKNRFEYPLWKEQHTKCNDNGILVRYTQDNKIALKSLSTKGLIMTLKDFRTFSEEIKLDLKTLTSPDLYRLIIDIENTKKDKDSFWNKWSSLYVFNETLSTELELTTTKVTKEKTYKLGIGFNQRIKKTEEQTLNVFDDWENTLDPNND